MSSRVVVKFREGDAASPHTYRDRAEEHFEGHDAPGGWRDLEQQYPGITLRTLIRQNGAGGGAEDGADAGIEQILDKIVGLARQRQEHEAGAGAARIADPRTFYFVQTEGDPLDLANLARGLARLPGVEAAYWDPPGREPQIIDRPNNPLSDRQSYLDPAPLGMSAEAAWKHDGGTGRGIGLVDVERGWYTSHPDLPSLRGLPLVGTHRLESMAHGTKTLGVICAVDNHRGVVGVAPETGRVRLASHHDPQGFNSVENAIFWSLLHLNRGDVLLLEVAKDADGRNSMPAEAIWAVHLFVRIATLLDVMVVAAAGNGNQDLDRTDNAFVDATSPGFVDSGSLLVGAALLSEDPMYPQWRRWSDGSDGSNHGRRVGCFGMAGGVWTTTVVGDPPTAADYAVYDGTSAASAMVAGAALAVQGAALAVQGARFAPAHLRRLLQTYGTRTTADDGIGVMPDLDRLMTALSDEAATVEPMQPVL